MDSPWFRAVLAVFATWRLATLLVYGGSLIISLDGLAIALRHLLGAGGEVRASDLLRLNVDLPVVIEFFDQPVVVDAVLGALEGMVPKGHVVAWRAGRR